MTGQPDLAIPPRRFVAYMRVSTERQGRSGLGLEAQREAVRRHAASTGGEVIAEMVEVESGKNNARPQLAAAMAACKAMRRNPPGGEARSAVA